MKSKFKTLIVLAALATVAACHHDPGGTPSHSAFLKMKINGTDWTSTDSTGIAWVNLSYYLTVTGAKTDNDHRLLISVPHATAEGDYSLTDSAVDFDLFDGLGHTYHIGSLYPGTNGTVHLNAYDQTQTVWYCSGTFSGVAIDSYNSDTITITNGEFSGSR